MHADESDTRSYPVLSGVGIALGQDQGELIVGAVITGSSADKSGCVHRGDRIVAIQTGDTRTLLSGKSIGEAASAIRGPSGTNLVLTLLPDKSNAEIDVHLTRAPLALEGMPENSYRSMLI